MNPVDHPHGGGEGSQPTAIYKYGQKTPWGKPALGLKTRRRKSTNAMIIRGRSQGRRGNMSRSLKKGPYVDERLQKRISRACLLVTSLY